MPAPNGIAEASVSFSPFCIFVFLRSPSLSALFLFCEWLCPYISREKVTQVYMQGNTPASMETDGKPPEVKEKLPIKRSKGSLGSLNMITGKNNEHGKTEGTSVNGLHSKR